MRRGIARVVVAAVVAAASGWSVSVVSAGERVTAEEIRRLLEVGTPQDEVVRLVRDADEVEVRPDDVPGLERAGAGPALLDAIRARTPAGGAFSLDTVYRMLDEERTREEILDRILTSGTRYRLSAKDKQALIRRKAPNDVILALEGRFTWPDLATFTAEHRLFSIQHPKGWDRHAWYTTGGYVAILSPDPDVTKRDDFSFGIQVQSSVLYEGSAYAREAPEKVRARERARFFNVNRALEPTALPGGEGMPEAMRVGGYPASSERFALKMRGVACLEQLVAVAAEDTLFQIECIAPKEEFEAHAKEFERSLQTFRAFPDRVTLERRADPLDAAAAVEQHREAVVHVRADFGDGRVGMGSGFFVRSDGYLLTNHHVVCAKEEHTGCGRRADMQLAKSFAVFWDQAVEPKRPGERQRRATATLVDTMYDAPAADLALLRVASDTPFKTLTPSPVGRLRRTGLVVGGDKVVALGFPLPDRFPPTDVMSTEGVVGRLMTAPTLLRQSGRVERLEQVLTTAQIQPGNSGGPCVDLRTNGVIGLNTTIQIREGQSLGYFGVCPIDEALHAFPQLAYYPYGRDLPPEGHLELAAMLLDASNTRAAGTELNIALERESQLAPKQAATLYYLVGRLFALRREYALAAQASRECLERDPDHGGALVELAYLEPGNRVDKSIELIDRCIRSSPGDWNGYYHRAEFQRRAGRYEAALEDTTRALDLGGWSDPTLHRLIGRIHLDKGHCGPGVEAFQRAIALDGGDVESKLGIVECAVRSKDVAGALVEYGRIAETHPDEPRAHEVFGRFLLGQQGRGADGLQHLVSAVTLTMDRDEPPATDLLEDAADAAVEQGKKDVSVILGRLLHRNWPSARARAHLVLERSWAEENRRIAEAHSRAGRRIQTKDGGTLPFVGFPPTDTGPLTVGDVSNLVAARYEPSLFLDVLAETNLAFDFRFDPNAMGEEDWKTVLGLGWKPWDVQLVNLRHRLDQVAGGPDLGRLVERRFVGEYATEGSKWTWVEASLTNRGEVALTGFRIEYSYRDKAGRALWTTEAPMRHHLPPLLPGTTQKFPFAWHTYADLRSHGVDPTKVDRWDFAVVSARNASYLLKVGVKGGFKDGKLPYVVLLSNGSPFHLRDFWVQIEFLRKDGTPILADRGSQRGRPIRVARSLTDLTLAPGDWKQVPLPDVLTRETLSSVGFPSSELEGLDLHPVVLEATPFTPESKR